MWQTVVERLKSLTMEQRIAMVVLVVCGILAIGLSVYRLQNTVRSPFLVDKSLITDAKNVIGETDEEKIAREKRTDTDGDSLSDWDETNIYRTNPNLRDSCGDGYADNIRVLTGKNVGCVNSPNLGGDLDYSQVMASSTDLFTTTDGQNLLTGSGNATGSEGVLQIQDINQESVGLLSRDPAAIRDALIQSGKMETTEIEKLTDEQLLEIYDWAIEEDEKSVNANRPRQSGEVGANPSSQPFMGIPTATTTQ